MTTDGRVLIEVQELTKKFGDNLVLDGISTEIRQGGGRWLSSGPSGSGKSTFLRSLNLLEVPTGGRILFEGVDITDPKVDINRHRQKIGMVFQQFNLFPPQDREGKHHPGPGDLKAHDSGGSLPQSG